MSHPARDQYEADDSRAAAANGWPATTTDRLPRHCLADVATRVGGAVMRDELLCAVRRIDWRFLMRNPTLGHVALLGDDDPELVRALRWFSASLSLLDLNWNFPSGQAPRFDQVVLRSRRASNVSAAAALVEPGGVLYWEIERGGPVHDWRALIMDLMGGTLHHVRLRRRGPSTYVPSSLTAIRRRFERAGFEDVRWHWHRPGFRDALDIVPLQNDAVLDHIFGKHHGGAQGRIKRNLGSVLRKLGLLHVLVPCLSVMATKRP